MDARRDSAGRGAREAMQRRKLQIPDPGGVAEADELVPQAHEEHLNRCRIRHSVSSHNTLWVKMIGLATEIGPALPSKRTLGSRPIPVGREAMEPIVQTRL